MRRYRKIISCILTASLFFGVCAYAEIPYKYEEPNIAPTMEHVDEADYLDETANISMLSASAVETVGAPSKRKTTFDYPLYGDPALAKDDMAHNAQKRISDEEFFGLWNEKTGDWALKPYWNYEDFPGLAAVEAAAKRGDYYAAKTELLEYYRTIQYQRVTPVSSITASNILRSQLLEKNFYAVGTMNGIPVDIFTVTDQWKDISIDVTSTIKSNIGMSSICFELNTIDKEESYAEFMSRESSNAPVLTITVNGTRRIITAQKDGYIVGGNGANEKHGSDTMLVAHESGYYMHHDENTKRPYLAFDLSSLSASDNISSASLILRGHSVKAVDELNPTGEKEILLYNWNDTGWEEDALCWNSFSEQLTFSCNDMDSWDYLTSNSTTVKGKICFFHRGNELSIPASVYNYTKDERYAYTFLRQQMAIVNYVGCDPAIMNSLDMSGQISRTIRPVFLVLQSQYMTPEIFTALAKHFWQLSEYQAYSFFGTMTNNWASYATQAVYDTITLFQEFACADEWLELVREENTRIIGNEFVLPDGSCVELAQGYTKTLLATIRGPFQTARKNQAEAPYSDEIVEKIQQCLYGFVYGMAPGFHGFQWGDSQDYDADNIVDEMSGWWPVVFPEETEFEFFAKRGASGSPPDFTSISFPDGLRTIMRNGWDERALALQITSKQEGSHAHYDANSLSMWAYGKFLITDQGYGTTLTGDMFNYMRSPAQHNLVTMNEKNSAVSVDGIEKAKELNDTTDYISYSTAAVPDANEYRRSVLFPKSSQFWIVSDYIVPKDTETNNTYQQYWHMLPEANISIDEETKISRSNFNGANVLVVPIGADEIDARLEDSVFSPGEGAFVDTKKAAYHKSGVGSMTYDTLLIPMDMNKDMKVMSEVLDTGLPKAASSAFVFRLTETDTGNYNDYTYYHLNDASFQKEVQVGRYSTDGTVMLIKEDKNGKVKSIFVKDASYIKDKNIPIDGNYLVKTKDGKKVDALSVDANGQLLQINSSELGNAQIGDITIYGYGIYSGAVYNSDRLNTSQKSNYLYFGDKPVMDIEPTATATPTISGSGGNSGGGGVGGGGSGEHAAAGRVPEAVSTPMPSETSHPIETREPSSDTLTVPDNIAKELRGYWGETEIERLYLDEIVKGDSGGLRLYDGITRAEFTTLLCRTIGIEEKKYVNEFSDVAVDDWFAGYIQTGVEQGWIDGDNGKFRPDDHITREEICKLLVEAIGGVPVDLSYDAYYADRSEISDWASDYVYTAKQLGIMNGYEDGSFKPKSTATRGEAFVAVYRFKTNKAQ